MGQKSFITYHPGKADTTELATSEETCKPSRLVDILQMSDDAPDNVDEEKDPPIDLNESMKHDADHIMIDAF